MKIRERFGLRQRSFEKAKKAHAHLIVFGEFDRAAKLYKEACVDMYRSYGFGRPNFFEKILLYCFDDDQ